jgi:hypothetical protein
MVLIDRDPGMRADRLGERADDLVPGRVERVEDAPVRVPALAAEVVFAVLLLAAVA